MENGNKRRTGKDVLLMVYRKIATCYGNDILEKLTEEETAVEDYPGEYRQLGEVYIYIL